MFLLFDCWVFGNWEWVVYWLEFWGEKFVSGMLVLFYCEFNLGFVVFSYEYMFLNVVEFLIFDIFDIYFVYLWLDGGMIFFFLERF